MKQDDQTTAAVGGSELSAELGQLVDAEMAEYSGGAYADHGSARDQLQRFAAEVMAPLQARIRELTLYAAQVEAERDDARADALRAYTKLNGLHVSARAHRDRVRELEAVHEDASGAVLQERERCARIVERINGWTGTREIAAEIRGETQILRA